MIATDAIMLIRIPFRAISKDSVIRLKPIRGPQPFSPSQYQLPQNHIRSICNTRSHRSSTTMYLPLPFAVVPMMVLPLVSGAALASESKLLGREATLWSGAQDVSVSMHPRGTETAIGVNCKGSTLCRNSLANDCSAAYSNIRAGNIYTGGSVFPFFNPAFPVELTVM